MNNVGKNYDSNEYRLTTIDNPFDPFDQFKDWYKYDVDQGYFTCNYLASIANFSDYFTEQEQQIEINKAIDAIMNADPLNIYLKVQRKENKQEVS